MKRLFGSLTLVALVGTLGLGNASVANGAVSDRCTAADVQLMAHTGPEVVRLWNDPSLGNPRVSERAVHIVEDCQFRLFDNNDSAGQDNPEVPHVFSQRDYFLGGIISFWPYTDLTAEFDRADAFAELRAVSMRMFFAPAAVDDADLPEITLRQSGPRDARTYVGPAIAKQWYTIFRPGSLAPGEYRWRLEERYPGDETTYVSYGSLIISPGQ